MARHVTLVLNTSLQNTLNKSIKPYTLYILSTAIEFSIHTITMLVPYLFLVCSLPHIAFSSHCTTETTTKTFQKCMNLPTQQASIAWTFHPHNSTLELVFFGSFISPSGWVGWGINPTSPEMTGTRSLIAFPDPNSGQVVLLPYILDPTVKLQKSPLLSRPLDIHLLSSSAAMYGGKMATVHNGAAIQISGTMKLQPNKTKIHIVWNRGLYVQGYSPTIHPTSSTDLSSIATLDVLSGSSAPQHTDLTTLRVIHGIVNAVSWGIMLPMGAITARYLRHIQALGPAWFYVHAGHKKHTLHVTTTFFYLVSTINIFNLTFFFFKKKTTIQVHLLLIYWK